MPLNVRRFLLMAAMEGTLSQPFNFSIKQVFLWNLIILISLQQEITILQEEKPYAQTLIE
jgi:hypothetical protein